MAHWISGWRANGPAAPWARMITGSPHRLIQDGTFHFYGIFYSKHKSIRSGKCQIALADPGCHFTKMHYNWFSHKTAQKAGYMFTQKRLLMTTYLYLCGWWSLISVSFFSPTWLASLISTQDRINLLLSRPLEVEPYLITRHSFKYYCCQQYILMWLYSKGH